MKAYNELRWLSVVIINMSNNSVINGIRKIEILCANTSLFFKFFSLFVISVSKGGTRADPLPNVTLITPCKPLRGDTQATEMSAVNSCCLSD